MPNGKWGRARTEAGLSRIEAISAAVTAAAAVLGLVIAFIQWQDSKDSKDDPENIVADGPTTSAGSTGTGPAGPSGTATNISVSPNAYPNEHERALLTHIPDASRNRCQRAEPLGLGDIAGVHCEPSSGATAVWYYQFSDVVRMRNAYGQEVTRTGISGGTCSGTALKAESSYPIGTSVGGRLLCFGANDGRQWIEWTNESLLIFARANSPSATVIMEWWQRNAGPV